MFPQAADVWTELMICRMPFGKKRPKEARFKSRGAVLYTSFLVKRVGREISIGRPVDCVGYGTLLLSIPSEPEAGSSGWSRMGRGRPVGDGEEKSGPGDG